MKQHPRSSLLPRAFSAFVLAIAVVAVNAAPPPGSWTQVWSDEFNGTSIDSSKWSWGSLPWGGQHHTADYASWITPEDSYVSGGSLWLRCRKATGSEFGGYPYSEGFVHSNGKMNYTYGYVEIRARYPVGKGVWPAFWSLSSGWPPEFDIAEYFGSDNRMHMGLAYGTCCPATWNSSNFNEDFANWHTYGLEWGPGYAIWSKDGAVKKTIYASYVPTAPMYLILNSGMRYDADATTPFPNYFQVDYVRSYTLPSGGPVANGTYRVINRNSQKALDVANNGTANGANVQQWTYNGGNNQRWTITHLGNNQYKIIGVGSAKSLDVNGASTADGANVQIWTYNGANNQRWTIAPTSGGYFSVRPVHSNKGLDVAGQSTANGANVQQWSYWGGNNQQWGFQAP